MIRGSIRRPVTITMVYLVLTALGIMSWNKIPIEQLPNMTLPSLSVSTGWGRASAEVMEAFVTAPLEAEIQQVRGVDKVTSRSGEGSSNISVAFKRGTDMNFARIELMERITAMRETRLPPGVRPNVSRVAPEELRDLEQPILDYRVTGPYVLEAMREQVDEHVVPAIKAVEGVADVSVSGGARRLIRIDLNEDKIVAYGIRAGDVTAAIQALQITQDVGVIREGENERALVIRESIDSVPNIMNLVVSTSQNRIVRVSDIGTVHDTFEESTGYSRVNGFDALTFNVTPQARVNTVQLVDTVKVVLAQTQAKLLSGMQVKLMTDRSLTIREQLKELRNRTLLAAGSIFAVLLIFLRSFRSTLVVFSTIAFASLGTLNLMYFSGHTLNVLTLTGLAMGFGMVVDNAIVVLENIFRRWRNGDPALVAAEDGSREVVLAIMAATMTTLVVFIPFLYMQGTNRAYYLPLVLVIGFSLIASQFVAFSFIPALATKLLGMKGMKRAAPLPPPEPVLNAEGTARKYNYKRADVRGKPRWVKMYAQMLVLVLRRPWWAIVIAIAMLGGSYNLFHKYVRRGGIWNPGGTQRSTVNVSIRMPNGEELERTDALARFFEDHLRRIPEVEEFITRVSATSASINITFPDSLEYTYAPHMVYEDLATIGTTFAGPSFNVYGTGKSFSTGGGIGSLGSQRVYIYGYNFEKVKEIAEGVAQLLRNYPRVQNVDPNGGGQSGMFSGRATEVVVQFDRERLGMHGITVQDASSQVLAATRGQQPRASLKIDGEEIQFGAMIKGFRTQDMEKILNLTIQSPNRTSPVRLRDVAFVYDRPTLVGINRENQQYTRSVLYEFRGPAKLAERVRKAVVNATEVPEGYKVRAESEFTVNREDQKQINRVLALSLVLVFMVTAALFESIRQPFCVLLTVPMALIGVFLVFFYIGASFSREAYIGVIIMGGIVVNNSILLVDRINRLRRNEGWTLGPAIIQGTLERVRPIVMTSAVTIIGLLPLVLFQENVDRNIWNALAYALMGGLTSSTILVLSVTPAIYFLLEKRAERRAMLRAQLEAERAVALPGALPVTGD